ncbi:trihelix transcription factor ENAP1-like [Rutidosis leptorrhynchoides]|uniref:trihelix transcription factor ENAP1-like n=1 Tax=Rutidosis leptorrhynchoides TaxID=125765 RepID=UPI003A9943BF
MDDTRDDSKYLTNYNYTSSNANNMSSQFTEVDEEDDELDFVDDEEQELEQEVNIGDNEINGSTHHNDDRDDDDDDEDEVDDDDGEDHSVNMQRHPKKRKLKSLLLSYEFAPRVPPPTSARKPLLGGRNTHTDWSEHETFVLLEAWGNRFLQCGRKSLRSDEWQEVANQVSQVSKMERTDSQCRNRLDTLKKKYKKEKFNSVKGNKSGSTNWVYFKKMDMLLSPNFQQTSRVDSRVNVVINPSVNPNRTNGVDETRGISGNSDSLEGDNDSDMLPPKKLKSRTDEHVGGSFKMLAESINKFSDIYEKIENSKIQQMIELEKMRMEFHKDLELQKRQILERAQAEIAKVGQGDYEDNDVYR